MPEAVKEREEDHVTGKQLDYGCSYDRCSGYRWRSIWRDPEEVFKKIERADILCGGAAAWRRCISDGR